MQLEDKVAIITGGSKGIGRAIALAFATKGADVVVAARTLSNLQEAAAEIEKIGRKSLVVATDLTDVKQPLSLTEKHWSGSARSMCW